MPRSLAAALGVIMLLVTVGVVGCQALFAAAPPISQPANASLSDR